MVVRGAASNLTAVAGGVTLVGNVGTEKTAKVVVNWLSRHSRANGST